MRSEGSQAYAALFELLLTSASVTYSELQRASDLCYDTVSEVIRLLRLKKLVYVCAWDRDALGRHSVMAFRLGNQKDVKRPSPMTATERMQRYRERVREKAQVELQQAMAAMVREPVDEDECRVS